MPIPQLVVCHAQSQLGLVTRTQLLAGGATEDQVRGWVRRRTLVPRHRGVYAAWPVEDRWRHAVLAAVLAGGAGAVASHGTAVALHDLDLPRRPAVHVLRQGPRPPKLEGVTGHTTVALPADERCVTDGVPTTTVARSLVDVAYQHEDPELMQAVADAVRRRLVSREELGSVVARYPTRRGATRLAGLVQNLHPDAERLRSRLEGRYHTALDATGLSYRLGYPIHDAKGRFLAEGDVVFVAERVVVEIDGLRFHATPDEKARDDARQNRLVAEGWLMLRYSAWDLEHRLDEVVAEIARVVWSRRVS